MSSPERTESAGIAIEIKRPVKIEELRTIFNASIGGEYLNQITVDIITGNEGRNFQPIQVNPIRVVNVQTVGGIQRLIQDGHHTADGILKMNDDYKPVYDKAVIDYNNKHPHEPTWQPTIIDVTTSYQDTSSPQQPTISMSKYFEIVAPYTVQQADVLEKRAGLYAMNYWPSIADGELSAQLSSFATLMLLAHRKYQKANTKEQLAALLRNEAHFFADATLLQREQYIDSICTMWRFVQDLKIPIGRVFAFAQQLLLKDPDKIGGKQKASEYFAGTSTLPFVRGKQGTSRELVLRNALKGSFDRLVTKPMAHSYLTTLMNAMQDPSISLSDLEQIAYAESPSTKYATIHIQIIHEKNIEAYQQLPGVKDRRLRKEEITLLGRNKQVPIIEIQAAMRAIDRADEMMPKLPDIEKSRIAVLRANITNPRHKVRVATRELNNALNILSSPADSPIARIDRLIKELEASHNREAELVARLRENEDEIRKLKDALDGAKSVLDLTESDVIKNLQAQVAYKKIQIEALRRDNDKLNGIISRIIHRDPNLDVVIDEEPPSQPASNEDPIVLAMQHSLASGRNDIIKEEPLEQIRDTDLSLDVGTDEDPSPQSASEDEDPLVLAMQHSLASGRNDIVKEEPLEQIRDTDLSPDAGTDEDPPPQLASKDPIDVAVQNVLDSITRDASKKTRKRNPLQEITTGIWFKEEGALREPLTDYERELALACKKEQFSKVMNKYNLSGPDEVRQKVVEIYLRLYIPPEERIEEVPIYPSEEEI